MKFDNNTLLRVAMKGICNVVNRHIQSGSIIDKDHLQELEQDNIIRWYRTEIAKATGHYPKSIPVYLHSARGKCGWPAGRNQEIPRWR